MYPEGHYRAAAFELALEYGSHPAPRVISGVPVVRNITFEDISIVSSQSPGSISGLNNSCFHRLTLRNVTFGSTTGSNKWSCSNVEQSSFVHVDVVPPVGACVNDNGKGACSSTQQDVLPALNFVPQGLPRQDA